VGVLLTAGILIACNFIADFALLALARMLFAIGLALLFTLSESLVITCTTPENRGKVIGWYATSLAVGTAAGPALVALTGVMGSTPFFCGSALFVLTMIPVVMWVDNQSLIAPVVRTSTFAAVRVIPIAFVTAFVFGVVDNGGMSMLSVYSTLNGYDYRSAVMVVSAATLGGIFLQIPLGYASNRQDPRTVLLCCGVGAIVAVTVLPTLMANIAGALGASFVFGGLLEGLYTVGLMCIAKYCRSIGIASANGCFVSFCGFGEFVGPLLTGASTQALGANGFVLSLTVIMAVYVALFGLMETGPAASVGRASAAETV
jgi:MFS family permease